MRARATGMRLLCSSNYYNLSSKERAGRCIIHRYLVFRSKRDFFPWLVPACSFLTSTRLARFANKRYATIANNKRILARSSAKIWLHASWSLICAGRSLFSPMKHYRSQIKRKYMIILTNINFFNIYLFVFTCQTLMFFYFYFSKMRNFGRIYYTIFY